MEIVLKNDSLNSDKKETIFPIAKSEIRQLSHYQSKPLINFKFSISLTALVFLVGFMYIDSDKKENKKKKTTISNSSISTSEPVKFWGNNEQNDNKRIVQNVVKEY